MNTSPVIVAKRITVKNDPILDLVEKTYTDSFPVEERRDFSLLRNLLVNEPAFELYAFLSDDHYVGFITCWQFTCFVYVEHFAIDSRYRNAGLGAKAMHNFLVLHSTPCVLEVELPNDELCRRRIGFYQRLGFKLDDHDYLQPPYHPGDALLPLRLMTYGDLNLNTSFDEVSSLIAKKAYGVK